MTDWLTSATTLLSGATFDMLEAASGDRAAVDNAKSKNGKGNTQNCFVYFKHVHFILPWEHRRYVLYNWLMQKWLKSTLLILSVSVVACCALLGVSSHSSSATVEKSDCSVICSSHGSQQPSNNSVNNKDEDEKEPTPPLYNVKVEGLNLAALYLAPIAVLLGIFYHERKRLLSTQLRF